MKKNIFKSFKLIAFLAQISLISLTTAIATTSMTDTPAATGKQLETKMDLMVKVADLQRQASQKQATDPKVASNLRAQAKQLTDQANKMK